MAFVDAPTARLPTSATDSTAADRLFWAGPKLRGKLGSLLPFLASTLASSGSTHYVPLVPRLKRLPSPSSSPSPTGRSDGPPLPARPSSCRCRSCSSPWVCCLSLATWVRSCSRRLRSPSSALWMRWSIALSRARRRSFSALCCLLSPSALCNSVRNCFTWATSVATVSRGVSPAMPRAFISSGVSVLAAPLEAGWPPGAPENSLMPTNTSSSAIGISSHLSSGLLFIARSSGRAGRGGRRQVHGGVDRAQRRQQRLGQAVAARDQVEHRGVGRGT